MARLASLCVILWCAIGIRADLREVNMIGSSFPGSLERMEISQSQDPRVSLTGTVAVAANRLEVRMRVENRSPGDIYVFDVLWRQDRSGKPVADPEQAYRFERNRELRLLLGPAPLPRMKTVTYRNVPYATAVRSGASLAIDRDLTVPAKEYSVYFAEPSPNELTPIDVRSVAVLVMFVDAKPGAPSSPCPFNPAAVKLGEPGVWDRARMLVWQSAIAVPVAKRTDAFDRLTLPGEKPERLHIQQ